MSGLAGNSLTRRAALFGVGSAALATMTPVAHSLPITWLWVGEKIAEGCLTSLGAGAIARALRGLRGDDVARLHDSSLVQVARTMRQELHADRLAQINSKIDALVTTLGDYHRAQERLDRLEFATDHARSLVAECKQLCERGPDGEFWLPGLASFAPAVSLNIAILQERARRFDSRGELCSIEAERVNARKFIEHWRAQRGLLLKRLVAEPQQVMLGVDDIADVLERIGMGRLWVWTCDVDGRTTRLEVRCESAEPACSQADERLTAQRLAQRLRDTINAQRFLGTEQSANKMLRNWFNLSSCQSRRAGAGTVWSTERSGPERIESQAKSAVVEEAAIQHLPQPVYPRRALAADRTGRVTLRFTIDIDGGVRDVTVVSVTPSGWSFEHAAGDALRQARCTPKMVDGVPVNASLAREFVFDLRG